MVPHLTTALAGPLLALEAKFLGAALALERTISVEEEELI